jgi:hypothetical protein
MESSDFILGQELMRKRVCSILSHHMDLAMRHHGVRSDLHLRYSNLLEEIRGLQVAQTITPQNPEGNPSENDQRPYEGIGL